MRIGIFGGSFDPVHYGHLLLAEYCREQARLDEVWFVPAATAPHKRQSALASGESRARLLRLAIAGHEAFRVSDLELRRGGISYTAETLESIHAERPEAELFLLMGADSLRDLPNWRRPETICRLAWPLVVGRHGSPPVDFSVLAGILSPERIERARQFAVEMPLVEYSSTEIRRRVAAGKSIRYQTPDAVVALIDEQGLYR